MEGLAATVCRPYPSVGHPAGISKVPGLLPEVGGLRWRIWAYHDGVDLGGPAMARIARDYGYTLAELRKL